MGDFFSSASLGIAGLIQETGGLINQISISISNELAKYDNFLRGNYRAGRYSEVSYHLDS